MLAAVYHGPNDFRVEQVSRFLKAGPGEVLLRVLRASICGTDLRIFQGGHRMYPAGTRRIPGHEVVGALAEIGAGLAGYTLLGNACSSRPTWAAGHCRERSAATTTCAPTMTPSASPSMGPSPNTCACRPQAVLQGNLMPVADGVDPAVAALIEPFACVLRGQNALRIQRGRGGAGDGRRADWDDAYDAGPAARRGAGDRQRDGHGPGGASRPPRWARDRVVVPTEARTWPPSWMTRAADAVPTS